ncbi:MAG: tellurium resistance protein TerC [Actinomycetota bacterium]
MPQMDATVLWGVLAATVAVALILDLFVFHRGAKEIPPREAFVWSGIWLALAVAFGGFVWWAMGSTAGTQYFTGYLIEKSLSVDNVAVFAILFTALAVPPALRYRALTIAVILAIVLRGILIAVGAALLDAFWWMPSLFGVFLVVTAVRMARHTDPTEDPENSRVFKLIRRVVPVTSDFHGERLTIVEHGRRVATPLLVTLLALAAFDLIFAIDSVPAIYAITDDPYIVLAANAFALLGLRALYFAIATSLERFHYLQPTLAIVLGWVGLKMIVSEWYKVPAVISLSVVALILLIGILASIRRDRREHASASG